jgi:hypothetical protein
VVYRRQSRTCPRRGPSNSYRRHGSPFSSALALPMPRSAEQQILTFQRSQAHPAQVEQPGFASDGSPCSAHDVSTLRARWSFQEEVGRPVFAHPASLIQKSCGAFRVNSRLVSLDGTRFRCVEQDSTVSDHRRPAGTNSGDRPLTS